jgi:uncharacterized protein YbcV (DUF1398 family)
MFTTQQLKAAHAKVKSGADYPAYVQELKSLGVTHYDFVVATGINVFYGMGGIRLETEPKYSYLDVAKAPSLSHFKESLSLHQAGSTDFFRFCRDAAEAGVDKWVSDLEKLEVSYLDTSGTLMIREMIPG